MPNCLYYDCRNTTRNVNKNITFHRLPSSEFERKIWLGRMGLSECKQKFGYVCSEHFRQNDLLRVQRRTYVLPNVAPFQYVHKQELSSSDSNCSDLKKMKVEKVVDLSTSTGNDLMNRLDLETMELENFVDLSGYCDVGNIDNMLNDSELTEEAKLTDERINEEHNYCQRTYRMNYRAAFFNNRRKFSQFRRTIQRLRKEIKSVQKEASKQFKPFQNFHELPEFIRELFLVVLKHFKTGRPKQYSPELRQFALTLHYYSVTAYNYVRNKFLLCLPCDHTIRNWYRTVDGSPGFSDTSLNALQSLQQRTPYKIVGCISVDGMHLRKHLQSNGNSTTGYVDFGGVIETEKRQMANEALNFMFVGMNVAVILPLGYFFINGIGAQQLLNLLRIGRQLVYDCGIISATIAYDGLSSNFSMSTSLGCDWSDPYNIQSELLFNDLPFKSYAFPDMPHMLKLWRCTFHDLGIFLSGIDSHQKIEWKYIVRLFEFQNKMNLHMGNKLRKLHVNYKNQIMKVYLATQLFSNSVADAIEICDKSFNLPDFRCSEATVKFVRIMNDLFDIFNSIDMKNSGYKQPLHRGNHQFIMDRLEKIRIYILNLKQLDQTPMYKSSRNTAVIGSLMLINSLREMYKEYVEDKKLLTFIPTYKANQDSLEIFHCTMRSHSGYNSNPTCVQYGSAFKKTLLHGQLNTKKTGNCIPLEDIQILHANAKLPTPRPIQDFIADIDFSEDELDGIVSNVLMERCVNDNDLDVYVNIIAYKSGFVAKRVTSTIKCKTCVSSLITDDENDSEFLIIHGKRRGGLFWPSRSVREICSVADKTFNHSLKISGGSMLHVEFTIEKMVLIVAKYCMENTTLFEELEDHFRACPTELHFYVLVKSIASMYLKVRVRYLNKILSANNGSRQKKRHETHFLGV